MSMGCYKNELYVSYLTAIAAFMSSESTFCVCGGKTVLPEYALI